MPNPLHAVDDTSTDATEAENLTTAINTLGEQIDQLTATRNLYRARLGVLLGTGSHKVAGSTVSVTTPRRFDADAFEAQFPAELQPGLYGTTLDAKKAKAFIEVVGIDPAPFFKAGKVQVTVK